MNPTPIPKETLRQESLHRGIFGLPLLLSIALLLPTMPVLFLLNLLRNTFNQLSPNVASFPGPMLWSLLIVADMLLAVVFFLPSFARPMLATRVHTLPTGSAWQHEVN